MTDTRWTRREWLSLVAAGTLAGAAACGQAPRRGPLGVQLYTVRQRIGEQAAETLEAIARIGYEELELGRSDLDRLVPMARELGLRSVSTHIEAPLVTGNWGPWQALGVQPPADDYTLDRAFGDIAAHGVTFAVVAYLLPPERGQDTDAYRRFGDQMNRAGEAARRAGVTLGYHNHGFEFEPLPDGRRPLDVLVETFDPALVTLELDVFWVAITGADPVAELQRFGRRVALVHLKDKAKDAPVATDERQVPTNAFVEVGAGALDFPRILAAAEAAGVQHFFVEQDHTPGDPIASLQQSYGYLTALGFGL